MQGFKIRLEPNNKQITKLFQCAGVRRFAYNWTLGRQQENYTLKGTGKNGGRFINDKDLRKEFTQLKKLDEYKWLNYYSNNITKQATKDACDAYTKFFSGKSKFPKFKSRKKSKPSFYVDTVKIKFTETHVKLEKLTESKKKNKQKFNWIKLSEKEKVPFGEGVEYLNPRISFDGLYWYISVNVKVQKEEKVKLIPEPLGIDVGIKDLAVCSNGEKYDNINKTPKIKKLEKRLKRLQRRVSRKYEMNRDGKKYAKTKNIIKLEAKINKLHKKLTNTRTDYRHKTTTEIVKTKPWRIVVEDLNVSGMMKNRHLSKSISQQGLHEFHTMLEYKCKKYGIEFIRADKWYPSSKTCSECGYIKQKLSLSEREFNCEECGISIDRDLNAAINLSRYKVS
ncbi:RNA-guided endonuclease TnpB family protein [Clostridium malenominatum]|uniref:RNA-guided endonuclease TnpB family protein n=1 Tax=Clostridium malenominatum TaxID=1539 RepID=A0ABN1IRT2_9CLOT